MGYFWKICFDYFSYGLTYLTGKGKIVDILITRFLYSQYIKRIILKSYSKTARDLSSDLKFIIQKS